MTDRELMQDSLQVMEAAIKSGDWKVDGSCDPEMILVRLRDRLAQPEPEPVAIGEEWKPCVKLPIVVHVREQRKRKNSDMNALNGTSWR
jgi:hypothetical protein